MLIEPRPKRKWPSATFWAAVAAIGTLATALVTYKSVEIQAEANQRERDPAMHLSCRTGFAPPVGNAPGDVYLMDLTEDDNPLQFPLGKIPVYNSSGHVTQLPRLFTVCAITNYGHLPAQNVQFQVRAQFMLPNTSSTSKTQIISISGVSAGESHDFALANNTSLNMSVTFDRDVTFVGIDGHEHHEKLIVDTSVLRTERSSVSGTSQTLVIPSPAVSIRP